MTALALAAIKARLILSFHGTIKHDETLGDYEWAVNHL